MSQIRQKAQEYLSKGQTDKAIQEYRRLISIESKNPNLYNELGDIYLRGNDKSQAVQNYEKASVIYEKVALYNNAVAVCKKILRIEPDKIDTVFKLSELRAKQKLTGETITFFTQYVESVLENPDSKLARSQKDVDLMIQLMPTCEPILAKAVEVYEKLGLKLMAVELYTKLASIVSGDGDERKQAQYQRKIDDLKRDLRPEEIQKLNEAVVARSDGAASPVAQDAQGEPAEAAPAAPVAAAGPEEPDENSSAARDASPLEDGSSAEMTDEEASPEESNEHEIDANVQETVEEAEIVAAMSQGSEMHSVAAASGGRMKQAAPQEPSHGRVATATETPMERFSVDTASAQADAGSPMLDAGEREGNLAEEITSDVEMNDLRSHYDLGMAYLEMGLFTEAIKDFQIASRCADLQLSSMEMIGYCFLKHGQPRLAVKQLSRALEIAKASGAENLGIHYNLGLAHELLGELPAAREHFEEVYIVDMSFRDVTDKMKKLNKAS
ncbi:MAG: tetratricopeptide repeat protein [Candidatus Krumholzibacteria bacterium]|nr:tetratricopeptide repeat protein [Candidatus Krumholzibacteria bacterium]